MNAHTPEGSHATVLTEAIVKNVALLHYLAGAVERPKTKTALAEVVGKDPANLDRAMKLLMRDGIVTGWDSWPDTHLTDLGQRVLHGLRVIDGHVVMPEGDVPANVRMVAARLLVPNPDNPRKDWSSEKALREDAELKASVARTLGPRLPIEAYPPDVDGVQMIEAGERRWRVTMANIADGVFPDDHPVMVITKPRPESEQDMLDAMVEENIQHRQLTYTEEARYFERSIANGRTQEDMAGRCKRSLKHVQDYLRLLKHTDVLEQLEKDEITLQKARSIIAERNNPALFDQHQIPKAKPAAPAPQDLSPEQAAYNALSTSPRMALIVCELADKVETDPADGREGFTEIAGAPSDSLSELLVKHQVLMVMRAAGHTYAAVILKSDGSRRWLEDNGFYEGAQARLALLRQLRHEVDSFNGAKAEQTGGYLTSWLNIPPPLPESPAPVVQPGLVGDDFSRQLREANAEVQADAHAAESELNDQDRRMAEIGRAALEKSEPGSTAAPKPAPKPAVAIAVQDGKIIAEAARDIGEQLAQWRAEHGRAHWSTLSAEELTQELVYAFGLGRPLLVMTLMAIGRQHLFGAQTANMLRDAVARYATSAEG